MPKTIFISLIILGLIVPLFALGGNLSGPIVPCGTKANPNSCTLCDIFVMIQMIIDFVTAGLFVLAGIFVAVGGVRILASAGSPEHVDAGKRMITSAITGIVIALLSWVILNMLFLGLFGEQKGFQGPWNKIQCVGGGVIEYGYQDTSYICHSTECSDCYACTSDCIDGTDCAGGGGGWCQRSAPSGSNVWVLSGINSSQKGDASSALTSFLNCMYSRISGLIITSISSNTLCSNPSCNIGGPDCGHAANSCHYGGTICTGYSYAVDFGTNINCTAIRDAALGLGQWSGSACNSSAWVNWETNHTHVSINNTSCGCNEGIAPTACPN
jgi:amino acid transporter